MYDLPSAIVCIGFLLTSSLAVNLQCIWCVISFSFEVVNFHHVREAAQPVIFLLVARSLP